MWRGSKVGEDVPSECPSPDAFYAVRETNMGVRRHCTKAHTPITLMVTGMMIFLIDWSQFQKDQSNFHEFSHRAPLPSIPCNCHMRLREAYSPSKNILICLHTKCTTTAMHSLTI